MPTGRSSNVGVGNWDERGHPRCRLCVSDFGLSFFRLRAVLLQGEAAHQSPGAVTGRKKMEPSTQHSLDLLRDSLNEAQATVRSYDTKAQIVGVGYIFALGIVGQLGDALGRTFELGVVQVLIAWGIVVLPIILFGIVLYPSRKTAPKLSDESVEGLEHILYVDPRRHTSVEGVMHAAQRTDPVRELAFELLKVSNLRELKRRRFVRALFATAVSFLVLFGDHFSRVLTPA